jgi:ADP-ribose pyrophosphatase
MKIPPQAKCVFKGVIFDVYQWQQEMYDGTFETFEMLKRPNTIQVIPIVNNKIILSQEQQPTKPLFTSFLGGRQEKGEDPLDAAKRELLEEAGMESNKWELYKLYEPFSKFEWAIYLYIARDCRTLSKQNLDPGEKISLHPVTFEEFVDLVTAQDFWGGEIALDIMRMEKKGTLEEFRKRLFKEE